MTPPIARERRGQGELEHGTGPPRLDGDRGYAMKNSEMGLKAVRAAVDELSCGVHTAMRPPAREPA
jgi:hypothetical protein